MTSSSIVHSIRYEWPESERTGLSGVKGGKSCIVLSFSFAKGAAFLTLSWGSCFLNAVRRAGIAVIVGFPRLRLPITDAEDWGLPHRSRVTMRDIGFTSTY